MKKIGKIMMLLMGIHLYSQETILPSDMETIRNLELSLKDTENQLNTTKAVKIASLFTIGAGICVGSVAVSLNRLQLIDFDKFNALTMVGASCLAGGLITSIVTTIIESYQHEKLVIKQEDFYEYLSESSNYFIGEIK